MSDNRSKNHVEHRWNAGPNMGTMRFGLAVETTQFCHNDSLWESPYVRPGPEKGLLWYVRRVAVTVAVPWWRGTLTFIRPAPEAVRAHERRLNQLVTERRRAAHMGNSK